MTQDRLAAAKSAALMQMLGDVRSQLETPAAPPRISRKPGWRFLTGSGEAEAARTNLWNIASAFSSEVFPMRCSWLEGTTLEFAHPSETAKQLFVAGDFDPNEFALLDRFLSPGMTFVDVGANVGVYSAFAAKKVGVDGAVLAFEPSMREFLALSRNIAINRLANVSAFMAAAGEIDGDGLLNVAPAHYDGLNSMNPVSFGSASPNIRYTTDDQEFGWCGVEAGRARIRMPDAAQLEILIYAETPFSFDLKSVRIDATNVSEGSWRPARSDEVEISPSIMADAITGPCMMSSFGGIALSRTHAGVRIEGAAGAGVRLRWTLQPSPDASVLITGAPSQLEQVERQKVRVVSLDSMLGSRALRSLDVIKLDIEGGEFAALAGARRLIASYQPLIIAELADSGAGANAESARRSGELLAAEGYAFFHVADGAPRPATIGDGSAANIVAVPARLLDQIADYAREAGA